MAQLVFFGYAVLVLCASLVVSVTLFSGDSFRFIPQGDTPGVIDVMTRSLSSDRVNIEYEKYHAKMQTERDQDMVDTFYNLATDFYEYGWGTSFHFAHTRQRESHDDSIRRHEERVANLLGLRPGMKVLDVGCGVGGPARSIAKYSGANIVGITINEYQVKRARYHNEKAELDNLIEIVQGDFTNMSFANETFDAAYAIEATVHAPHLHDVYSEVFRTLKPGAKFVLYEWLTTPLYDPNDEEHVKVIQEIEYGNALPPLRNLQDALKSATEVGFEVISEEDLALDRHDTRPWYHRLDMSWISYTATDIMCKIMETLGLAPKGTVSVHGVLLRAASGLVDGGKRGIFTPMHLIILRKP